MAEVNSDTKLVSNRFYHLSPDTAYQPQRASTDDLKRRETDSRIRWVYALKKMPG